MTQSRKIIDLRKKKPASQQKQTVQVKKPVPRVSIVKTKRRKMRLLVIAIIIIVICLMSYAISVISYLPQYNITSVRIDARSDISGVMVRDYIENILRKKSDSFLSPTNIFIMNLVDIENVVKSNFPQVGRVEIRRDSLFANTISVLAVDRIAAYQWCDYPDSAEYSAMTCYSMDNSGFIFANSMRDINQSSSTSQYVFTGGLPTASSVIGSMFMVSRFSEMIAVLDSFAKSGLQPSGANIVSDRDWNIKLSNYEIKLSFGDKPEDLLFNLTTALSNEPLKSASSTIEYIDLRFGDRIFYKLNGDKPAMSPMI